MAAVERGELHRSALARAAAMRAGVHRFGVPTHPDRGMLRCLRDIARESAGVARGPEMDPQQIDIRRHPHAGRPIVSARGGEGTTLGIRTMPTMRST